MRVYGLTGGIASGKSTAAALFRELGVPVLDADQLSRELVEPGQPALAEIAARWPQVVIGGWLDRGALAALVFAQPAERTALEALLHPRIQREMRRRAAALQSSGVPYLLYEAALIFEAGSEGQLDGVILVSATPETQRRRLALRDGLSSADIERRLSAQLPLAEKRARARHVIENDGDEAKLRAAVLALDARLRQETP